MKIKNYIMGSILLLTIIACVVPGISQSDVPPTFDLNMVPTMVVLTANAIASQTAAVAPPMPFETLTPTLAPTESATATPKVSFAGTSLFLRDDQTTLFTDYRVGIKLIVPAGWLAVRINEDEYYDAWVLPELSTPAYQRALASIQDRDPNEARLYILDIQEGHLQGGLVTNVNLFLYNKEEMALEDNADVSSIADSFAEAMPGLEVLTAELSATPNGIPIGISTSKMPATTVEDVDVIVFYKQIFLKSKMGLLTITLSTTQELKDTVLPAFDAMIETMILVKE